MNRHHHNHRRMNIENLENRVLPSSFLDTIGLLATTPATSLSKGESASAFVSGSPSDFTKMGVLDVLDGQPPQPSPGQQARFVHTLAPRLYGGCRVGVERHYQRRDRCDGRQASWIREVPPRVGEKHGANPLWPEHDGPATDACQRPLPGKPLWLRLE